jgi:hypothetical protein
MRQWEYAMLRNPESGTDSVIFSRPQPGTIVQEFSAAHGRGRKAEQSNAQFLHLNLNHTNSVIVAGLLGERGWDLVNHAVLTGGHEFSRFVGSCRGQIRWPETARRREP